MAEVTGHRYDVVDGDGGQWLVETCDQYPEPSPIGRVADILSAAAQSDVDALAEVLAEHDWSGGNPTCCCGWTSSWQGYGPYEHRLHVAEVLAARIVQACAGEGALRELAEAWDAGKVAGLREGKVVTPFHDRFRSTNPYHAALTEGGTDG